MKFHFTRTYLICIRNQIAIVSHSNWPYEQIQLLKTNKSILAVRPHTTKDIYFTSLLLRKLFSLRIGRRTFNFILWYSLLPAGTSYRRRSIQVQCKHNCTLAGPALPGEDGHDSIKTKTSSPCWIDPLKLSFRVGSSGSNEPPNNSSTSNMGQ